MAWIKSYGGGASEIKIGDLRNTESNGSGATAAHYGCYLKLYTNGKQNLNFDSFTGVDYGGTGLGATALSIVGNVSGTLYTGNGAIYTPTTLNVSADEYVTITIQSQHMPSGSNYYQTVSNITLT